MNIKNGNLKYGFIYTGYLTTAMSSATLGPNEEMSGAGAVRVTHGADERLPSRAVVEAVAELAGVGPAELADETGIVLYDYVDPDALNAMVGSRSDSSVDVSLTVGDYAVSVDEMAAVARPE